MRLWPFKLSAGLCVAASGAGRKFSIYTQLTDRDSDSACRVTVFLFLQKQHSTLSKILHTAAHQPICAVSPPISSKILVLKGLANPLATVHLCSIAEWLTTLTVKRRGKKGKNKEEEDRLVSLPPSLCRNFMPLISSFSITEGSFHCCQLDGSLYVLHPTPTHRSLSLSSLSLFRRCVFLFVSPHSPF